jgi:hypothetical protein
MTLAMAEIWARHHLASSRQMETRTSDVLSA